MLRSSSEASKHMMDMLRPLAATRPRPHSGSRWRGTPPATRVLGPERDTGSSLGSRPSADHRGSQPSLRSKQPASSPGGLLSTSSTSDASAEGEGRRQDTVALKV